MFPLVTTPNDLAKDMTPSNTTLLNFLMFLMLQIKSTILFGLIWSLFLEKKIQNFGLFSFLIKIRSDLEPNKFFF